MRFVHLDFETRNGGCDLKKAGAWRYAEDLDTGVMCLCYSYQGHEYTWKPGDDPGLLYELAKDPEVIFVAHNAQFEQAIWQRHMVEKYGFPPIPEERWEDTLASCAHRTLPLALDKAAKALDIPIEKDKEGNKLTLSMSCFDKKTGNLPELTPEKLKRITEYCAQDVRVEQQIERRVGLLCRTRSASERPIWIKDQQINRRGVRIDVPFVRAAQRLVEKSILPLKEEFRAITDGINPGQVQKVVEWCQAQGAPVENLRKSHLAELLDADKEDTDATAGYTSLAEDDDRDGSIGAATGSLSSPVRRALEIRALLGSASIKKLDRMLACVCEDGRARGLLQYHAANTGRWGGRLLQPQNFPRGDDALRKRATPEQVVDAIMTEDPEYVDMLLGVHPIEAVAHALRYALIPDPGKVFLVGDYAGIEMRGVLALAGQEDKCLMLATGADVYLDMACDIYNRPRGSLTKDNVAERTIGKNTVLGCGFGMGYKTFHARYCQDQTLEFAEDVVNAYRTAWAPLVPELWAGLHHACGRVIMWGVQAAEAYGCTFRREGQEWMSMQLPSRWQKVWYHLPGMRRREGDERDSMACVSYKGSKSAVNYLYGGKLTENAVQALARGVLCSSVRGLEQAGMQVVLTVHDEIVCEVPEGQADLAKFKAIMEDRPQWAVDMKFPIAVEAWEGDRYKK